MKKIVLVTSGKTETAKFPKGIISGIVLSRSAKNDNHDTVGKRQLFLSIRLTPCFRNHS